ncbi:unnamed protein product [Schistocephalus solidus]|uniref:AAA_lid_7 domain-containing protein n=1 Tax=Schistocephalus solidus TaxID=70667 RepID=A0A183SPG2_SCHSO|nr:unnamed protein product [Schistocephalus solidus]
MASEPDVVVLPGAAPVAPAPSPISGRLDSVLTPGIGVEGGESTVDAAQVYYHFKLNHAQVTVSAPPFRGTYGGRRRTTTVVLLMALVARELPRYKVDIAALSETLFSEQSQLEDAPSVVAVAAAGLCSRPKARLAGRAGNQGDPRCRGEEWTTKSLHVPSD